MPELGGAGRAYVVLTLGDAGLRPGKGCALRSADVDPVARTLRIGPTSITTGHSSRRRLRVGDKAWSEALAEDGRHAHIIASHVAEREIQRRVMAERHWGSLQRPQRRSGDGERRAQVRRCLREMAPTRATGAHQDHCRSRRRWRAVVTKVPAGPPPYSGP